MKNQRILELDLLRASAILLMVVFHFIYDLNQFGGVNINFETGFWYYVGKISALTFIFVSGISSGLSRNSVKRGIKVLGFGLIITIVTFLFDRNEYIRFGILHFLGVSMLLFPFFNKLKKWQLFLFAALALIIGKIAVNITVNTFLLLPLGFMYNNYVSMDYYPLFPYISVFVLGILAYKIYYYRRKSILNLNLSVNLNWVNFISRNSLKIYLIHQPILICIIYIVKFLIRK